MNHRPLWIALAAAGALASSISACNGGSSPASNPTPGPTCSPPSGAQSQLVYPAPNATGIPDTFGQVIVGSTVALPSSWNVLLLDVTNAAAGGTGGGTFATATPPFPQPTATPSFANPVYQGSSFSGLQFQGEVVHVYINDPGSNCTPLGPIGQFTTQ